MDYKRFFNSYSFIIRLYDHKDYGVKMPICKNCGYKYKTSSSKDNNTLVNNCSKCFRLFSDRKVNSILRGFKRLK